MGTISYFRLQHKIIAHSFPILPVALVSLALGHWTMGTGQRPLVMMRSGRV